MNISAQSQLAQWYIILVESWLMVGSGSDPVNDFRVSYRLLFR